MTAETPDRASTRIDFEALTDRLRVLSTSRRWNAVESAMARLERLPPEGRYAAQFQEDVESVRAFAVTIRESYTAVAYSLCCASLVARLASSGASAWSARDALANLSIAYHFGELSSSEVAARLLIVWNDLTRYAPTPLPSLLTALPGSAAGPNEVRAYFTNLKSVLTATDALPESPPSQGLDIQRDAWAAVRRRVEAARREASSREESREEPPTVAEVICSVAGVLPSSVVGYAVRSTPATVWSSLFVPGVLDAGNVAWGLPPWVPAFAANALGFQAYDEEAARQFVQLIRRLWRSDFGLAEPPRQESAASLVERSTSDPARRPQTLFVIQRARDSLIRTWVPSRNIAVLPLTVAQAETFLGERSMTKRLRSQIDPVLPIFRARENVVAMEYPPDADAASEMAQLMRRAVAAAVDPRGTSEHVALVTFGPQGVEHPVEVYIPAPERFEDLLPASLRINA